MVTVYLDQVFVWNMIVDYLLLLATARLSGRCLRRLRFLGCAAVGGFYAALVFLPSFHWLAHPFCKIGVGAAMAWFGFCRERGPFRMIALFFLLSAALGGVLLAIGIAVGLPGSFLNQLYCARIDWKILLFSTCIFTLLLQVLFRCGARYGGGERMDVTVSINQRTCQVCALHDTGNALRNPMNGKPAMVLEQHTVLPLLPTAVVKILEEDSPAEEKMARLYQERTALHFSLLPFRSVGVPSGLLLAVQSDYIQVGKQRYEKILIGLVPHALGDGDYQALWGEGEGGEHRAFASKIAHMARQKERAG